MIRTTQIAHRGKAAHQGPLGLRGGGKMDVADDLVQQLVTGEHPARISRQEMEQYLHDWIGSPQANARLRAAWANPALREQLNAFRAAQTEAARAMTLPPAA